jgi:signal transduction histidine kinase
LRRLYVRLLTASEEEPKKIAPELHDYFGPRPARLDLAIGEVESLFHLRGTPARKLAKVREGIREVVQAAHDLSHSLHPVALSQIGLATALEAECATFSEFPGITVSFSA